MKRNLKSFRERCVLLFHTSILASWTDVMEGFNRYARQVNWRVQVADDVCTQKAISDLIDFWKPEGILAECGVDKKHLFIPESFGTIPTVYLVANPDVLPSNAPQVSHEASRFGRLAAHEYLALGLKSFAFFGFQDVFWSEERRKGFIEALALNGCKANVFEHPYFSSAQPHAESAIRKSMQAWLRDMPRPCGLLAANDKLAVEILNLCHETGIRVPEDISVMGIDNNEVVCESQRPTLTSIYPNFIEAGYRSAELLDDVMASPSGTVADFRRIFSPSGIVHRASTLRFPQANATVSRAIEIIRLGACNGLRPKDVFAQMPESRRAIELYFRRLTGHSVLDEILAVRLAQVKKLLARGTVPLETVAERCGWKSSARLRVFFLSVEGVSMRDWQRQHAKTDLPINRR